MQKVLPMTLLAALAASASVHAQTVPPPDAGTLMQQLTVPPAPIEPSVNLEFKHPAPSHTASDQGPTVRLQSVGFDGVTQLEAGQLQALLAPALGQPFNLQGLRGLADRVTVYYRSHGYPFARAYLPPQHITDGRLQIKVIEGRYGTIQATGEPALAQQAQAFLAPLTSGEVIEDDSLERMVLILGDLPGMEVTPVMRPGDEVGTGDLDVRIARVDTVSGRVSMDNAGNRYSGRNRAAATVNINSPFLFGDKLTVSALRTSENMNFGRLAYAMPLGTDGVRGHASYAHTSYDLGGQFATLGATGTASVASVGLSYPLVRTRSSTLVLSASYQRKKLQDKYETTGMADNKSSRAIPVSLQFDLRDGLWGGGITYGVLSWTAGRLRLDTPALAALDSRTAHAAGAFRKLDLDLARLQRLGGPLSLFVRLSGQTTNSNLDSSEMFTLGGADAVRAYPQGEVVGDQGWFGQAELRYALGHVAPYAFYDRGTATLRHRPWSEGRNHRTLAGYGVGVRLAWGVLDFDAAVAWRSQGGASTSDPRSSSPQMWLRAAYTF